MGDAKRMSIYVGRPVSDLLAGYDGSQSGRINGAVERYLGIVASELRVPRFSRAEWCAVFDALSGASVEATDTMGWQGAWASIADSPELDEKWGVDHDDIARRLRALPPSGRAAVWEAAVRFWSAPRHDVDELIAGMGIATTDKA